MANAKLQSGVSADEAVLESLEAQAGELARKYEEMGGKIVKTNKEMAKSLQAEARVLRSEAAAIVDGLRAQQISTLNQISGVIGGLSRTALVGGAGLIGGVFGFANKYVKDAEEATEVTRAWEAAQESLKRSGERTGAVFAQEALPMLEEAARLASKAAGFIEANPEIVSAALETGKILVGLSVLGTLASKGIKLVADAKSLVAISSQLTAAKLQDTAANKQLAAAQLRLKDIGGSLPGGKGGSLLGLGPLAAILSGGAAFAAIGTKASQFGASLFGTTPIKFWEDLAAKVGITLPKIKDLADRVLNFGDAVDEAGQKAGIALTRLAGSENEEAVVSAFAKWQEDDRRLIEEAAENRKKILTDAEKAIANATRQYGQQRVDINKQFDKSRADIIKRFAESSKQEEINYAKARADIIKGTGEDIQRIEQQHQENIRQMTLEHNQRVEDLTASRDALGLAKEHRQFDQDLAESERETNQEIAQRRRETAVRLQELAAEYAAERVQRQVQFEQSLAENEVRRQEELKEAAIAHAEELKQLREQRAARLRELQEGLNAERLRRREVFIAEIRDLDSALLGERNLKTKYYTLMLQDAEKWLAAYRARLGGSTTGTVGSSIPTRDLGGYVNKGIYRMAWNGVPEFVMSGATTRAAERVIGGQLNQQSVMRALTSGRGNVTLNYQPRIDSEVSLQTRRAIEDDIMQTIHREFG